MNEDVERRRSPHLVHYTNVDEAIKVANRNTASETVRTLLVYGYVLDPPSGDKVGEVPLPYRPDKSRSNSVNGSIRVTIFCN